MTYPGRPKRLPRRPRICWNRCCNISYQRQWVSLPKATPIPSELEVLMQHLMGNNQPVHPAPMGRSSFTDMEVLIQNLLPVGPPTLEQPPRGPERRNRPTVVCFSCGESGHWCPTLDETFPFLPPGWQAERGEEVLSCGHPGCWLVVIAGVAAVPVSLPAVVGVVSSAVLAEGVATDAAPLAGEETITVGVIILTDTGSELPVESLESVCVTRDCLSVDVDVVLPEVSPVSRETALVAAVVTGSLTSGVIRSLRSGLRSSLR